MNDEPMKDRENKQPETLSDMKIRVAQMFCKSLLESTEGIEGDYTQGYRKALKSVKRIIE